MPPLQTTFLRDLLVDARAHPRGQPHLSAASGLVRAGRLLYLVADDEHHLGVLDAGLQGAVQLQRVRAGDLPADKARRKRMKADLEALALLPAGAGWPQGALIALGSGSRPNRCTGFLLPLAADGSLLGAPCTFDLSPLYRPLQARFADLNIEGAFADATAFHLLQRANRGHAGNACISYPLDDFLAWMTGTARTLPTPLRVTPFDLGDVDGIPYGFTDATPLPGGGWIFSAVAEDTQDSYADGRCAGAAIGRVSAQGQLQVVQPIAGSPKVEGIAWMEPGRLLLVTDADDPGTASQLLELRWPSGG